MRPAPPPSFLPLVLLLGSIAACRATSDPALSVPGGAKGDVHLDPGQLEAWRAYLAPQGSELAWESLPWLSSYADGVLAAQEQRRPLLLWVMNGHPLGCT